MSKHRTNSIALDETSTGLNSRIERLRLDFPALSERVNGQPLVYLDNASTTHKPRAVTDRIFSFYKHQNSNVHRGVHTLSQLATESYESARSSVREFIGAGSNSEVIFTRGTTESINLVSSCLVGSSFQPGDEILLTVMEHHSNIVPWQLACESSGAVLRVVPVDERGTLVYDEFQRLLTDRTRILAITHISNTMGTVNPVRRMIGDAHGLNIPVLIDGAQAVPHIKVDVGDLDCDFYCFSGHKMFGPTGIGVLYGKEALLERMPPYQGGGDMIESVTFEKTTYNELPHKFEAGTPNIAGAIGLASAIDYLENDVGFDLINKHVADLVAYAREQLSTIKDLRFIGNSPNQSSVISMLIGSTHPYDVGTILDRLGIAIRTGHHCTQPLMTHFGIPGTVRASFAFYNTRQEVDALLDGLRKASSILS